MFAPQKNTGRVEWVTMERRQSSTWPVVNTHLFCLFNTKWWNYLFLPPTRHLSQSFQLEQCGNKKKRKNTCLGQWPPFLGHKPPSRTFLYFQRQFESLWEYIVLVKERFSPGTPATSFCFKFHSRLRLCFLSFHWNGVLPPHESVSVNTVRETLWDLCVQL